MPTIVLETRIDAPVQQVFDLARNVERHTETMGHDERAIRGVTSGHLEEGDVVTWRARHFGIPMTLTVEITEMDAPVYFRDRQIEGPFAELVHDHHFERLPSERTLMRDVFRFASPAGPLGSVVDRLILKRYLRNLIESRNRELTSIAESNSRSADG